MGETLEQVLLVAHDVVHGHPLHQAAEGVENRFAHLHLKNNIQELIDQKKTKNLVIASIFT